MNSAPNPDPNRKQEVSAAIAEATTQARRGTVVTAVIVILVGVALLLNQLEMLPHFMILSFWPLVFVAFGLGQIVSACSWTGRMGGFALIAIGVIIQLNYLNITHVQFWELWPIAVIWVGFTMLRSAMAGKSSDVTSGGAVSRFNSVYVFSGTDRKITAKDFQGGRISAIFGGFKIDLTRADMSGDAATLEVNAVFGGGEIIVPETWQVVAVGAGVFGGFEDKTRHVQPDPAQPTKTLFVKGSAVFGGIVIRNW